ncbi:MAG: cardiolipin synthase [Oscillospiraceae bacterium]|nr:cardiolipin synthase [Oscillospiraceae bacterium]
MGKIFKFLLSRVVIFSALILIQVIAIFGLIWGLGQAYTKLYLILEVLSLIIAIYIINGNRNPSYKLAWVLAMLVFPLFGSVFYLFFGIRHKNTRSKKRRAKNKKNCKKYLLESSEKIKNFNNIKQEIKKQDQQVYKNFKYLNDFSYYPVYKNSFSEYLSPGEKKFEKLIEELERAKKFIFLEYFIIKEGFMWGKILNILEKKASQGVEVRIIYDDFGCLFVLPSNYPKFLRSKNIKCQVFNPLVPFINIYMNHRDHRKIAIIDGEVAFVGGTNLADEYININSRFGHWKDCDLFIKGEAVWSLTVMFLQNWNFFKDQDENWNKFRPENNIKNNNIINYDGYIQPFGDIPIDDENISENAYKNLINSAKRQVYITTPYLIIDNEMTETLILAAKSGIDVRIICPKIPDKYHVYLVSQAFFPKLIKSGVKIYLYTPGFIHSKQVIVDDELAIVGTANMDYRSFYLHFETGILIYKSKTILDIKNDFINTLDKSEIVCLDQIKKNNNIFIKIYQTLLKMFSPMM